MVGRVPESPALQILAQVVEDAKSLSQDLGKLIVFSS